MSDPNLLLDCIANGEYSADTVADRIGELKRELAILQAILGVIGESAESEVTTTQVAKSATKPGRKPRAGSNSGSAKPKQKDDAHIPAKAKPLGDYLDRHGPRTIEALAAAMGLKERSVQVTIARSPRFFFRDSNGVVSLTDNWDAAKSDE